MAALKDAEAITFAQLPSSILNQETQLKRDLAFYQRKLYEEKNKSKPDSLKMSTWKQFVFDLKREQEELQTHLKSNYNDYFELQYHASTTTIPQIQQELLSSNKALLEYFVGDSTIYVFALTQNNTQIHTIPKTPHFLENIANLQQALNTPPIKTVNKQAAYQEYVQAAHFLYQQLLAPSIKLFSDEIQELTLVADGILGYIPFETLLTALPHSSKPNYTLQNLNYLLSDYSINYAYSTNLLLAANKMTSKQTQETFGGFAPQFASDMFAENRDCLGEDLANLAHNQAEIEGIQEQIGGLTFVDTTANSQFFMEQADQYKILHLATHACVNDEDPLFSKIFFSDTYLALADIYNLRLNADLVVLSACNTGTGKLVNGEGIMSLSRGFMYANCPSVVTSLWQVSDRIAGDLMASFYQNLQNGFSKSEALRQAKLTHLQNSTNKFAAPYYWAAFVQLGNSQPIFKRNNWWFWSLIGVCFLVGIGLFFKYHKSAAIVLSSKAIFEQGKETLITDL
ncbi:MAG: CHAT domain-containing protein [Chitinophagales bacterium]